ncbi:MAG: DUF2334 domain-containing protein [Candidatus Eremiobacteraeota bacterium]|nr:DUF2334 domain-containing protein [Candidatus Eremiobacteraeota bacterium]
MLAYRRTTRALCMILIIGAALFLMGAAPRKKALIIVERGSPGRIYGIHLVNLLGHFNVPSVLLEAGSYRKGTLQGYPLAFLVNSTADKALPEALLDDCASYRGKFFWIGEGLASFNSREGVKKIIEPLGRMEGTISVSYRGATLTRGLSSLGTVRCAPGVKVHAWASLPSGERSPYIVSSGSFWHIPDIPFPFDDGPQCALAFCDCLHDFLEIPHGEKHYAVIRIEDVNPLTDPEAIIKITDLLSLLHAPFLVPVVPVYRSGDKKNDITLSQKPALIKALQYATRHGGTIVLHGFTHQYRGASTIDCEFWDTEKNRPLIEDSVLYVEERIEQSLDECFRNGIYPLLWETPHLLASSLDYRVIARHFSTASERKIFLDTYHSRQSFPFLIEKDYYGQQVIPEYLGYVPYLVKDGSIDLAGERQYVNAMLDTAKSLKCIRDGCAGFFFHPFMDLSLLRELVLGLQGLGYVFLEVRNLPNAVLSGDKAVVSGSRQVTLTLEGEFLSESFIDPSGTVRKCRRGSEKLFGKVMRKISLPPGWMYVAEGVEGREKATCALLWDEKARGRGQKDQEAFYHSMESLGIKAEKISWQDRMPSRKILIIPYEAAARAPLTKAMELKSFVEKGGVVVTDGFTALSGALGFEKSGKKEVPSLKDVMNQLELFTDGKMETVMPFPGDLPMYVSPDGACVGLVRKMKRGGIVFLSTEYDPAGGRGYNRFPTLVNNILSAFSLAPPVFVPRIEAYFDPGLRQDISIEELAKRWREIGIRAIHVGAWHMYPSYTYDYKRLIDECHRRGITVYAWLELPYLSKDFWERHPEFREKNYKDGDVQNFWRYPLALEDPACRKAVLEELATFFGRYDFDGVNLAELYFENEGEGPSKPETVSPFHRWAREDFSTQYGYDSADIFTECKEHYWKSRPQSLKDFSEYRARLIYKLHGDFISFLDTVRKGKKDFDIVITVVDSLTYPRAVENWGVDAAKIALYMERTPFTLMVEDPYTMWNLGPERYERIKKAYLNKGVPWYRLALNLNVVDFHEKKDGFACPRQTGSELFQMLRAASRKGHRVILYAESTLYPHDTSLLGFVMEAPGKALLLDPEAPGDGFAPRWINGELYGLRNTGKELSLSYEAPATCYVALPEKPGEIVIDGKKQQCPLIEGEKEWILCLPSGTHKAVIRKSPQGACNEHR